MSDKPKAAKSIFRLWVVRSEDHSRRIKRGKLSVGLICYAKIRRFWPVSGKFTKWPGHLGETRDYNKR
jgi:hypothetical protein